MMEGFCDSAGLCGWPYVWHYVVRAAFHLALVDPMLALVSLAGWTFVAEKGFAPKRQGLGFLTWVWVTAVFASFLREPVDAAVVDHWSKSYWDFATHTFGVWLWLHVIMWVAPRAVKCRDRIREQRRNMARRRA